MNETKTSPKDFFLHLGVIGLLYTIAVSFINLAWRIIDYVFPRETLSGYYDPASQTLSAPVATLIVVFPIFIILYWFLNREYKQIPEKRNLWIRKWLVYITLFIAGIVIVADLIIVLISFLSGELITAGFILKALAVLAVALAIFGYYIADLRDRATPKLNRIAAWTSGIIILALIVAGFSVMGSPRTQRFLRIDGQKTSDLQNLQWQIVNFWQQKGKLPGNLEALKDSISGFSQPLDPQTSQPYEYRQTGNLSFEFCAEFNLPSDSRSTAGRLKLPAAFPGSQTDNWNHQAGRYCFERKIDPELYPRTKDFGAAAYPPRKDDWPY